MYDAIIAGSGPGGSYLAWLLAKEGFNIALLDKNPRSLMGYKVCGEGIFGHCFKTISVSLPQGSELLNVIDSHKVVLPDFKNTITVLARLYITDRKNFFQRFINKAEKHGAEILPETIATRPLIKNRAVVGVKIRQNKNLKELRSRVVIDASGVAAVIWNNTSHPLLRLEKIGRDDMAIGYREILKLNSDFDEKSTVVYLNQKLMKGGYFWIFPRGNKEINVGVGGILRYNDPKPFPIFLKRILKNIIYECDYSVLDAGFALIPARRPLPSLVSDGLMLVGDAGSQTNPIHGGGICTSFRAAEFAARVLVDVLDTDKEFISKELLWKYSYEFMRTEGLKHAILEAGRLLLQSLDNKYLNNIMLIYGHFIEKPKHLKIVPEKISPSISVLSMLPSLAPKFSLLKKSIDKIRALYRNYPKSPRGIFEWARRDIALFDTIKKAIA
ncbi:MAG: geranylgeranyl reductase family protein [Candidatus Njordarchaeota archaeon]